MTYDKKTMTLLGLLDVIIRRGVNYLKDDTQILVQHGETAEPAKLIVRFRSAEDPTPVMVFVPASEFEALSEDAHRLAAQVRGEDPVEVLQRFLNGALREAPNADR